MPKGKGSTEGTTDILEELEGGENKGDGGGQAEVAVRGRGKTVGDALKKAGLKDAARDVKGSFNDLLKNPKNKIVAARIFPKQTRGADGKMRDCSDVVDMPPPMSLDEIQRHLQEEYGGKKWNVRVQDEDGEVLDAKNIDVAGDVKLVARPEDEFSLPTGDEIDGLGGNGAQEVEENPLDRDIANKEKESRALMLEKQNASLRSQIEEYKGKKTPEVDVNKVVQDALAAQEAKHRAELAERDKKAEMVELERRVTSDADRRFNELKSLIESVKAGNPAQGTALTEISHKIEMIQTSIDNKIDKALGSYREMTNTQINALEKGMDGKLAAIQSSLTTMQNHRPDNPLKDMMPLITSSIERSTSGYKEMVGPVIKMLTEKQEAEAAPPANPLEETLETLGKFNLLGDKKSGDFGSRVIDFAEKMGPEVFTFIREERKNGREVTEQTLKNHLKLQAEKISKEVSAAAANEIKKIRSERDQARGLPPPKSTTTGPQGQVGPSPVGNMSAEEIASRQRKETAPAAAPAPTPAPAAQPQSTSTAAAPRVQRPEPVEEEEQEEEEEEEEMTVEEEMAARVNSTLALLEREMKIRPRQVTWPNAAWDDLPAEVLDAIIFSNDEEDVYKAIEPHADKELSERIWSLVRADTAKKDFIVHGVNLIKEWAVQLQAKQREAAGGGAPAPEAETPPQ